MASHGDDDDEDDEDDDDADAASLDASSAAAATTGCGRGMLGLGDECVARRARWGGPAVSIVSFSRGAELLCSSSSSSVRYALCVSSYKR